jgi:hypothetical protein
MKNKRPAILTAICVFNFIGVAVALGSVIFLYSDLSQKIGPWYPPYLAFSAVVGLICTIGFWMMQRWGIITYTAFVGINQVVLIFMGAWNVVALILPGIVIGIIFWKYYQLME